MSDLVLRLAADVTGRGTTTHDGKQVFSVYNFINLVCQKKGTYAHNAWARLMSEDSIFKKEIEFTMEILHYHSDSVSFSGQTRRRLTPAMTLRALQRLLMILGGKVAAAFRVIIEGVFVRFQSGDLTMIEEIRTNAASDAPMHQIYRQALAQDPVTDTTDTRRMLDHDEARLNLELNERQMTLHERQMTLYERSWALHEKRLVVHTRT